MKSESSSITTKFILKALYTLNMKYVKSIYCRLCYRCAVVHLQMLATNHQKYTKHQTTCKKAKLLLGKYFSGFGGHFHQF